MKKANDVRWLMRNVLTGEFFKIMLICAAGLTLYLSLAYPNIATRSYFAHWVLIIFLPLCAKFYCQLRSQLIVIWYLKRNGESEELKRAAFDISAKDFSKLTGIDPLVAYLTLEITNKKRSSIFEE